MRKSVWPRCTTWVMRVGWAFAPSSGRGGGDFVWDREAEQAGEVSRLKRIATERHTQTRLNETRSTARPGGSHRACRRFAVIDGEYTGGVADRQQDAQEPLGE